MRTIKERPNSFKLRDFKKVEPVTGLQRDLVTGTMHRLDPFATKARELPAVYERGMEQLPPWGQALVMPTPASGR